MSILSAASRLVKVPSAGSVPNYVGDYDNGADYGIGAVVSTPAGSPYGNAGQLFIRVSNPNNPGYPPGTSSWSAYGLDATAMYRGSTKLWPVVDLDALDYINRVQAADSAALGGTQTLEEGVKNAINGFVIGCKKDGIWGKISTSAIFCGARSLQGALTRLTGEGSVPTIVSYGFVQSDYSRTLGIQGASSSTAGKYIDTRFSVNYTRFGQFPDDSVHAAAYVGHTHDGVIMGSGTGAGIAEIGLRPFSLTSTFFRVRDSRAVINGNVPFSAGFVMGDRQNQFNTVYSQHSGQTFVTTGLDVELKPYSTTILNNTVWLFRRNTGGNITTAAQFNGRILYFSIGRSIVLANNPRYVMTGTALQNIDDIGFNGQYMTSGAGLLLDNPNELPNTTITLEPYDPVTNAKRYVVTGDMKVGSGWERRIVYVSMHSEPSTSSGTISPVGHYQRVTVGDTSNPMAVTTESPYLAEDLQLLTAKYKARVDALIAGIQGSIV